MERCMVCVNQACVQRALEPGRLVPVQVTETRLLHSCSCFFVMQDETGNVKEWRAGGLSPK